MLKDIAAMPGDIIAVADFEASFVSF
jgi:hypothetical protein